MKRKNNLFYVLTFFLSLAILFGIVGVYYNVNYPIKYNNLILKYSNEYNLNAELVASLINEESSFNKNAVSSSGALGLMQILPSTGEYIASLLEEDFDVMNLFDPEINIKYGCYYLKYLSKKFLNENSVLCAYNAGETIVKSWLNNSEYSKDGKNLNVIPYKVTENYLIKINKGKKHYINRI